MRTTLLVSYDVCLWRDSLCLRNGNDIVSVNTGQCITVKRNRRMSSYVCRRTRVRVYVYASECELSALWQWQLRVAKRATIITKLDSFGSQLRNVEHHTYARALKCTCTCVCANICEYTCAERVREIMLFHFQPIPHTYSSARVAACSRWTGTYVYDVCCRNTVSIIDIDKQYADFHRGKE